jgi:uncharacterized protein RhaS with RHS repeats
LNEYAYGWRDYDPVLGKWNVIDQLAEKYYNTTPYAYVANNPITTIDPDGRYLFGLFGSTSQERKEARAEKYAAKVGGSVVKGEDGKVSVNVVRGNADGGMTITTKNNFSDFATLTGKIKNWTTTNKEQIIGISKFVQKAGNNLTKAGLVGAAVGAPIGGVGAGPGLTVATIGGYISGTAKAVEIATNFITGDSKEGVAGVTGYAASEIAGEAANKMLPGSGKLVSKEVKESIEVVNETIKGMASEKGEQISNKVLD